VQQYIAALKSLKLIINSEIKLSGPCKNIRYVESDEDEEKDSGWRVSNEKQTSIKNLIEEGSSARFNQKHQSSKECQRENQAGGQSHRKAINQQNGKPTRSESGESNGIQKPAIRPSIQKCPTDQGWEKAFTQKSLSGTNHCFRTSTAT
jgi:hypothetical protein